MPRCRIPRSSVLPSLCMAFAVQYGSLSADVLPESPDDDAPAPISSAAVVSAIGAGLGGGDTAATAGGLPAPAAGCPTAHPWWILASIPAEAVDARVEEFAAQGFRLHSLGATSTDDGNLYSLLFHADAPDNWGHRIDQTPAEFTNDPFWNDGLRPVSVALTLTDGEPRVASSWVADGLAGRVFFAETVDEMRARVTEAAADGLSPVWIDGARHGNETRLAVVFVADGFTRVLRFDDGPAFEDWRERRTDTGSRALHIVDLDLPGAAEPWIASIWQNDHVRCGRVQWKAHVRIPEAELMARGWAQHLDPPVHAYGGDGTVTLQAATLPGLMRLETDLPRALRRIAVSGGAIEDGAIVVLDTMTRDFITVEDVPEGNIRLRRWDGTVGAATFPGLHPIMSAQCGAMPPPAGCRGQPMPLADWQARLALQYRAGPDEWHEIARNGMPPDRYMPVSITAMGSGAGRRYSGAYILRGTDRVFTVVPHSREVMHHPLTTEVQDFYDDMDAAIRDYMEARLVPKADVAVAAEGRVVFSRLYRYEPAAYQARTPTVPGRARFRLASLTKPITAMAVMRLVEAGALDLDAPLAALPGLVDLLGPDWAGSPILENSARNLLLHIGGWDRDDPMSSHRTGNAFVVCGGVGGGMPVAHSRHVVHWAGQPLAHAPGTTYVYSNIGYFLLGRAIEAAAGASYEDFLRFAVLVPIGAEDTALVAPMGEGAPPPEPAGAVRHHVAGNPMVAAAYGFAPMQNPAHRRACTEGDADIVLSPYGRRDLRAGEDAGGGMVSTAVDLLRILLAMGNPQHLSPASLAEMMTRTAGQGLAVATLGAPGPGVTDRNRSFDARFGSDVPDAVPIDLVPETGAMLFLGNGYQRFGQVVIDFANLGPGQDLRLDYVADRPDGWAWEELTAAQSLDDASAGFATADGDNRAVISFDPPADWRPTLQPAMPDAPRYWLRVTALDTPGTVARAHRIAVRDAAGAGVGMSRVLGWGEEGREGNRHELFLASGEAAALQAAATAGLRVVGATSQTSAQLVEALPLLAGTALLRVRNIAGAGFEPGETLARAHPFGAELGRVGNVRERALGVRLAHNGLLPGVQTWMTRREDGGAYAMLFNQSQTGEAFWLPDHRRAPNLNRVIETHQNRPLFRWPSLNLID